MPAGKRKSSSGCVGSQRGARAPRPAEPPVKAAHVALLEELPFADREDFEDAVRGFIGTLADAHVTRSDGRVAWSQRDYGFLQKEAAPDTVNPSLWRQARLNCHHGLFEVTRGMYQVRGFDVNNMTVVEGKTGSSSSIR